MLLEEGIRNWRVLPCLALATTRHQITKARQFRPEREMSNCMSSTRTQICGKYSFPPLHQQDEQALGCTGLLFSHAEPLVAARQARP